MTWNVQEAMVLKGIGKEDKKLILEFLNERKAVNNLGDKSVLKIIYLMKTLTNLKRKGWNDFKGRKDVIALITKINESAYKPRTKENLKVQFKQFYRWLVEESHPPEIDDIKCAERNKDRKLPEDMLTEEDVKKMVDVEKYVRNKAILMTLWSSGVRAAEILGLRNKDILWDESGCKIRVSGKTGDRHIRIIEAVPYLREWQERWHPDKSNPDAPLWLMYSRIGNIKGDRKMTAQALSYSALKVIVARAAKKAGIKKPVHPHAWRASRATYLAQFLTPSLLKEFFGWRKTAMCDVYISLSQAPIDEAILNLHGKGKKKQEASRLTPQTCPRCKREVGAGEDFCPVCQYPMSPGAAILQDKKQVKRDRFLDKLMKKYPHLLEEK
jgi:integrase